MLPRAPLLGAALAAAVGTVLVAAAGSALLPHAARADAGAGSDAAQEEVPLAIQLEVPGGDAATGAEGSLGFIAGRVGPRGTSAQAIDVILLLDVSGSTQDSSGIDVDGDGKVGGGGAFSRLFGGGSSTNSDSILAAEVAAARAFLTRLDPRTTRAGVVIFSGETGDPNQDALLEVPLTSDYRRIERGLDEILLVPPSGGTNMYAGLRIAARELAGRSRRGGAQRYIVLLTDGEPTLPLRRSRSEPVDRVLAIARTLAKRGIQVQSFAIGPSAVSKPEAPREAAAITGGDYVAVKDIGELGERLGQVRFVDVASIEIRSRSLGEPARCQVLGPDGRFAALVPMQPGANTLELEARAESGSVHGRQAEVRFDPDAPLQPQLDESQRIDLARLRELCRLQERRLEIEPGDEREPDRRRIEIEPEGPEPDAR